MSKFRVKLPVVSLKAWNTISPSLEGSGETGVVAVVGSYEGVDCLQNQPPTSWRRINIHRDLHPRLST